MLDDPKQSFNKEVPDVRELWKKIVAVLGYASLLLIGVFVLNYVLTDILNVRDPLIGCWEIYPPLVGFCL